MLNSSLSAKHLVLMTPALVTVKNAASEIQTSFHKYFLHRRNKDMFPKNLWVSVMDCV